MGMSFDAPPMNGTLTATQRELHTNSSRYLRTMVFRLTWIHFCLMALN
jgi:hypothetical protein